MIHKRVPSLLLLTGPAILGSLLSCHGDCEDCDWPVGPPALGGTCPATTVLYRAASGAYRTSEALVAQDTCNAGVAVNSLQRYQLEMIHDSSDSVLIFRVSDPPSTLFLGPLRCNVGSSLTATESGMTGACQYERTWSSTLTVTGYYTLAVRVNETWHHVTGTGCPGSEGCMVSYQVTLER